LNERALIIILILNHNWN